jgi:hypothetical protein
VKKRKFKATFSYSKNIQQTAYRATLCVTRKLIASSNIHTFFFWIILLNFSFFIFFGWKIHRSLFPSSYCLGIYMSTSTFFFSWHVSFFPFVSDKKPFILHLMWNNSVTWLRVAFSYIWTNEWMNEQSPESFQKKIQDFFYFLFTNLCCFSFFLVLSQSSWSNEA